jgi:hypothetical protein
MPQVQRTGEWVSAQVGADRVMMNVASGDYVGLTSVGARIWDLLDRVDTVDAICAELTGAYDVTPEICRAEVQSFLAELAAASAVTLDAPS